MRSKPGGKPLAGLRIGIVREYMVKHSANDAADERPGQRRDQGVLRDRLGADLVESVDPLIRTTRHPEHGLHLPAGARRDPAVPHAGVPADRRTADGTLTTPCAGFDVTKRDYMVKVAEGQAPLAGRAEHAKHQQRSAVGELRLPPRAYLLRRGDAAVTDWAT